MLNIYMTLKKNKVISNTTVNDLILTQYLDGTKEWFKNSLWHREDGPAIEFSNGNKMWLINGIFHRIDGPAIEYSDGHKQWYVYGNRYHSFKELLHLILLQPIDSI